MKNICAKILGFIIAIAMMISTLGIQSIYAEEKNTYGDWEYTAMEDSVTITKYLGDDIEVKVPDIIEGKKVVEIGDEAFMFNDKMETITIPEGIESIGVDAFYYCTKLSNVEISDTVKSIKKFAFRYCNELREVKLPSELTEIEYGVFSNCKKLEKVSIPESVTSFKFSAFAYCDNLKSITIPKNVRSIEYHFEGRKGLSNIYVDKANKYFSSKDGVLYNKNETNLLLYPAEKEDKNFSVPDNVKK